MIEPVVGRIVWFWPDVEREQLAILDPKQPYAAQIAYVHNERRVNLLVLDQQGRQFPARGVFLRQPEDAQPTGRPYCEWMPYQKGQAAKEKSG